MQDGLNRQRKNVLWLASWYPNKEDRFTGDFIQRHAKAASFFNNIYVIHLRESLNINNAFVDEISIDGNLTEHIIYFKPSKGILNIFSKHLMWFRLYKKAIQKFIDQQGKPHLVHVHVAWKAGLIALWLKQKMLIPYVITEHWGMYNRVVKDNFFKKPFLIRYLIKKIFEHSKQFVSVSQYLANFIQHWIPNRKAVILPNVVDTNLFFLQTEKENLFTFIHVSNGAALKNVKGILNAFKNCNNHPQFEKMQLKIIGVTKNDFLLYAEELGITNKVIIKGEIEYKDVAAEMRKAHCFVLNSSMENSPCVIGEAHCCGLPVIATEVGGVPELVNLKNGILIPSGDEQLLSKAFLNVFNNYVKFNQAKIAEDACEIYSFDSIAKQIDAIYKNQ